MDLRTNVVKKKYMRLARLPDGRIKEVSVKAESPAAAELAFRSHVEAGEYEFVAEAPESEKVSAVMSGLASLDAAGALDRETKKISEEGE